MADEHDLMSALATTVKEGAAKALEKALNDVYKADPLALHVLIEFRVRCRPEVETDTLAVPMMGAAGLMLGSLGLLNAVAGLNGLLIVAHYTDPPNEQLLGFTVRVREEKKDGDAAQQGGHGPELRETTQGTP